MVLRIRILLSENMDFLTSTIGMTNFYTVMGTPDFFKDAELFGTLAINDDQ